jgi:hypothetical protein
MALGLLKILVGPIAGLLDKVIPDKDEREKMAHDIATMVEENAHSQIMAQMEINKQEAAHKSLFVAGWRPGAGWTCVVAMAFNFVIAPLINWATAVFGYVAPSGELLVLPVLDLEVMMPVLLGMLGLGGMRSYEKKNGVAREK